MGIDLTALIGHDLDADRVFELPGRLSRSPTVRAAAEEAYAVLKPRWVNLERPSWSWSPSVSSASAVREAWARREAPDLEGAAGFSVYVGPRAIEAVHIEKFAGFIGDCDGIQSPIRRLCRAVAIELGCERAIYLPDSAYPISVVLDAVAEGYSIGDIARRLAKDHGPPSRSIPAILVEGEHGNTVDGYFVDDFGDLAHGPRG